MLESSRLPDESIDVMLRPEPAHNTHQSIELRLGEWFAFMPWSPTFALDSPEQPIGVKAPVGPGDVVGIDVLVDFSRLGDEEVPASLPWAVKDTQRPG
jgi:hypothetical protein